MLQRGRQRPGVADVLRAKGGLLIRAHHLPKELAHLRGRHHGLAVALVFRNSYNLLEQIAQVEHEARVGARLRK